MPHVLKFDVESGPLSAWPRPAGQREYRARIWRKTATRIFRFLLALRSRRRAGAASRCVYDTPGAGVETMLEPRFLQGFARR